MADSWLTLCWQWDDNGTTVGWQWAESELPVGESRIFLIVATAFDVNWYLIVFSLAISIAMYIYIDVLNLDWTKQVCKQN